MAEVTPSVAMSADFTAYLSHHAEHMRRLALPVEQMTADGGACVMAISAAPSDNGQATETPPAA